MLYLSTAEAERRAHQIRGYDYVFFTVCLRPNRRVIVRRVMRLRVASRLHLLDGPRRVLLQAPGTAAPRRLLGYDASASRNVRQPQHNGAHG